MALKIEDSKTIITGSGSSTDHKMMLVSLSLTHCTLSADPAVVHVQDEI